ncbi:MAG: hypothetical protein QM731_16540 [Chitinophagaceae bacterium]
MRIKFYLAAICCLLIGTSFTNTDTINTKKAAAAPMIIIEGHYDDGNVLVYIDYNPGTHKVIGITVSSNSGTGTSYTVTGYDSDARVTYSAGVLTCTGFLVFYTIPGYSGTLTTSWTGDLTM